MADRVRMECPKCGYKCTPQWLNDAAHCLKCQVVLRRRAVGSTGPGVAVGVERRQLGEVSLYKAVPSDARESEGGCCAKSPSGMHYWKFGKCNYCQAPEPPKPTGNGAVSNRPTSAPGLMSGIKVRPASAGAYGRQTRPIHYGKAAAFAAAGEVKTPASTMTSANGTLLGTPGSPERNERSKIECQFCGYKCYPQWMNDAAHCLKCNNVVKTQPTVHQQRRNSVGPAPTTCGPASGPRRVPGEACTNKFWTPSSAMESSSHGCEVAPDGLHRWKFGKCTYCQKGEGKFAKAGAVLNPGAVTGTCASGGKCIYKFGKCKKCGASEF